MKLQLSKLVVSSVKCKDNCDFHGYIFSNNALLVYSEIHDKHPIVAYAVKTNLHQFELRCKQGKLQSGAAEAILDRSGQKFGHNQICYHG